MSDIQSIGIEFIKYLQTFHPHLDWLMGFFAILVKPEYFIVFVMPVLYWNFGQKLFFRLFALCMVDISIGESLRVLLAQPRPWWIADLVPIDPVTSIYSSPAGYSSFAIVFLGYLAFHYPKKWFRVFSFIMIISTGIAKMYEAAMLIDHMILGVIQGGLLLFIFIKNENIIIEKLESLSLKNVIYYAIGLGLGLYIINALALYIHSFYEIPSEWIKYKVIPVNRLSRGGIVYGIGFLMSSIIGYILSIKSDIIRLNERTLKQKIILTIIGLAGVVLLFLPIRLTVVGWFDSQFIEGILNILFTVLSGLWVFFLSAKLLLNAKN